MMTISDVVFAGFKSDKFMTNEVEMIKIQQIPVLEKKIRLQKLFDYAKVNVATSRTPI